MLVAVIVATLTEMMQESFFNFMIEDSSYWLFSHGLFVFVYLAAGCLALFLRGVLLSGVSSTIIEFFSEDPIRFIKNYIRGIITRIIFFFELVVLDNVIIAIYLGELSLANLVLPALYLPLPLMMVSFIVIVMQSFLEEKLFRDVMHRMQDNILNWLGIVETSS